MRRSTVLGLVGVVLVIGFGAYTAYWRVAAGKIEQAATAWRQSSQGQRLGASWQDMRVAGYPFSFRLELRDAALNDGAANPPVRLHAPTLSASLWPWDFRDVSFAAADGLSAAFGPDATPGATISAASGGGAAALAGDGGLTIWLSLYRAKADAGMAIGARAIDAWVIVPAQAPATHRDTGFAVAAVVHDLALPAAPPGLKSTVDDLDLGLTMKGALAPGPLREAAAKWRDDGGTVELEGLHLRWEDIDINASGTLALDGDLQPIGGLSGGISGFDQVLSALVAAGRIKPSDAGIARMALAMLATTGANGRPQISTSLTIQNGQMFLGPAKLGKAPRIDW